MNEKGSIVDTFAVLIIMFLCAIVGVVLFFVARVVNNAGMFGSDFASILNFIGAFSLALPIGFVGVVIVACIMVYHIRAHPAYMFMALLIMLFSFPVAIAFSAAWGDFEAHATGELATTFSELSLLSAFMNNLPLFILAGGGLIMVSAYMGYRRGG